MIPRLARSAVLLVLLVPAVAACSGEVEIPSDAELAELDPDEALADLPGVDDVEHTYDYSPDDFYVNEVVVDAEEDISVEELTAILRVMNYYGEGELTEDNEPVDGLVYVGEGDVDWSDPDDGETGIWHEPASDEEQAERAEQFLDALEESDGEDVQLVGDVLRTGDEVDEELEDEKF